MKREPSGVVLYVEDNGVNFLLVEQLLRIWSLEGVPVVAAPHEVARTAEPWGSSRRTRTG